MEPDDRRVIAAASVAALVAEHVLGCDPSKRPGLAGLVLAHHSPPIDASLLDDVAVERQRRCRSLLVLKKRV